MPINLPTPHVVNTPPPVLQWLLDSDPSIRWQVMRNLTAAPDKTSPPSARGLLPRALARPCLPSRDRRPVERCSLEPRVELDHARPDAVAGHGSRSRKRPSTPRVNLVRDRVTWKGCGPRECDGNAFFEGEVEPCINGQVAAVGAYFGQDVRGIIYRLLAEQLPDGGWNCEAANGSTRVVVQHHHLRTRSPARLRTHLGAGPPLIEARLRGQEYLLERRLFHRLRLAR